MPPRANTAPTPSGTRRQAKRSPSSPAEIQREVEATLASLKRLGTKRIRDDMGPRYGIHAQKAFGVQMNAIQKLAKPLARNHKLAAALWETGWYEARLMTAFVADPARITPAQMDRWCRDFDNWAVCDTLCFHLFDRVAPPLAFRKIDQWSRRRDEFVKRAAFALLAALALHDKVTEDEPFARCLPLIERAAHDERNFVKKGVSWALRAVGRRSPDLHAAAVEVAQRLSDSPRDARSGATWVGRDALRELTRKAPRSRRTPAQRA